MVQQEAVIVRNAVKSYGKELVFDGLNMTVPTNSIYGLLGPSGCGKTTLISCIVGIRHLDSGKIWVLGGNPGSKDSGISGPRVGYMPQEISLVGEFSVRSALYYFGRINGLDDEEIETRLRFFSELLQLPPYNHLVKNMSGGEQRRVSFVAALIHKPELIILDEPTVGMDPILREKIWSYLIQITQEENTTVLITTHYIDETKDANKIGLMRYGKLLAESAPQKLLEQFQCSFLEEAFLKLCNIQDNTVTLNEARRSEVKDTDNDFLYQDQNQCETTDAISKYEVVSEHQVSRVKRFKALLTKNGIQFLLCYEVLVFAIVFPIIEIGSFIFGIGGDPKNLKIGVVNDEVDNCNFDSNIGNVWSDEITCHFSNLSCRFLHNFDNSIATQEYYNISEARQAVQNSELNGLLYFSQNFSEAWQIRMEKSFSTKHYDILASQIQVFLDMGDMQIGRFMQQKLFHRFLEFYEDIMKDCKYSSKLASLPIRFEEPIYGTIDFNFSNYMAPTFILCLSFFLALTLSVSIIITDRMEGVWYRSIVQGVKAEEILLSHVLVQNIIIITHTVVIMLLLFPIWGLECKGPIFTVMVLIFLTGFCGLMYGFLISVTCNDYFTAHIVTTGSFVLLLMLNGIFWPVEGIPSVLRWFSYASPLTLPSLSMRGIIYKGYSISEPEVYIGFLINVAWLLLFFILTIRFIRSKSL
ncbi:PREDICTED: ABC transporter G family member 23-like [Cyphomyrmex costatus]|uniref:ABC transporter G family member 23 n=1 Tax=Cyphomyrmex costatus TaxID=456900 RepID=A0A195CRT1_9HYME|nr:PREDICTED: ABC transporter G family member 23-like [Cyphomyrmex costatus]KYN03411.1 ABC transporter G family member 23 [Cyphomyrmex costatus]